MAGDFGDVAQRLPHEHAAVLVMFVPQEAVKLGALVRGELAHGDAFQNFRFDWGQGQKHGGEGLAAPGKSSVKSHLAPARDLHTLSDEATLVPMCQHAGSCHL